MNDLSMKLVGVEYHFAREQLVAGLISVLKLPTNENTAK